MTDTYTDTYFDVYGETGAEPETPTPPVTPPIYVPPSGPSLPPLHDYVPDPWIPETIETSVWAPTGSDYALVGSATYDRLETEPRHLDLGIWTMSLPQGHQAQAISPDRLVSTTFRDRMDTWVVTPRTVSQSVDGAVTVTLGGFDGMALLARTTAWPNPAAALTDQPRQGNYSGPAETVIRQIVEQNLGQRYGLSFDIEPDQGRGAVVRSRPRFDNLLTEVLRLAKLGGIGVRFGLAPTVSATRARLLLSFYEPQDKSLRVHLSAADGSLAEWELTENEPTATYAIVGGAGEGSTQHIVPVTTAESITAAATWGGHREVFIDGPETFDTEPLEDAGRDALLEGAATTTLTMEADEPASTRAFEAFGFDQVTAIPAEGVEIVDTVSAFRIVHEGNGDPTVTPIFGDPDVDDADSQYASLIRSLRREVQRMKINRKRGTA